MSDGWNEATATETLQAFGFAWALLALIWLIIEVTK